MSTHSILSAGNETNWNRGAIINHYSNTVWAGSDQYNNGNLRKQDVYIPADDQISGSFLRTQTYAYDALNRLDYVHEAGSGQPEWRQDYQYDRWGNRTIDAAGTWLGDSSQPPSPLVPEPQFAIDQATNRLGVPSGQSGAMSYDAAGNLTNDTYTGSGTRSYDAEGRMTSAQFSAGALLTQSYTYDADGRRVRRNTAGSEVWQVYGFDGELLAEYAQGELPSSPQKEYGYRAGELLVVAEPSSGTGQPQRSNVAASSAGATATAQAYTADTVYPGLHFQPAFANDSVRYISQQGDRYWRDEHGLASWIQIDFSGQKSIDEVDVYTVADYPAYTVQSDPSSTQTFTQYGATAFDVQYWTGSAWATVQGGSVSGNSLVWRKLTFPAVTTSKIRVVVNSSTDGVARIAEVETWGVPVAPSQRTNVALSSAGATATAQNYTADGVYPNLHFLPAFANNGVRFITTNGDQYWRDEHGLPSWIQIDFSGSKTIDEVDVYTIADYPAYTAQSDPSPTQTFTQYGVTAFDVQYWTGSGWATVSGGSVSGNNLVWKKVTFPAVTTTKIRVVVSGATDGVARVAEVEAWTVGEDGGSTSTQSGVQWLVTDQLGTPRMVIDQTGDLSGVKRHDYFPFGEEAGAGVGGRTTAQGYVGDSVRQKFAGTERDSETGLDFMQARYTSSTQGRFTSTDPLYFQFMMAIDPQRFNLYAYARNNPLKFVDPDGEKIYVRGSGQTLLYDMAGGQEAFDANFQVVDGQVVLRDGVDKSKLNEGQRELLGLIDSSDNYLVYAGTDGAAAAALFKDTGTNGKVMSSAKERANDFTGNNKERRGGSLVGTTGRSGALQPANLANGDPVFCVIAYNTDAVFTQTGLGGTGQLTIADALAASSEVGAAQASGLNQVIRPGSFFIHEVTENREFSRIGASNDNYTSSSSRWMCMDKGVSVFHGHP